MNQCVPSWDLDNNNLTTAHEIHNKLMLDKYEVAELTWKEGDIVDMHGFDQPCAVPINPFSSAATGYTWEKIRGGGGTLESIVDRAIAEPKIKQPINPNHYKEKLASLFEHHRNTDDSACGGGDSGRDALVPSSNQSCNDPTTPVSSSYGATQEWSSRNSRDITVDTWKTDLDVSSTSEFSVGSTSYDKASGSDTTSTDNQYDSVYRSSRQKEDTNKGRRKYQFSNRRSIAAAIHNRSEQKEDTNKGRRKYQFSNRRSRAAAIHNQSEQKRRDRINQRIKTLQRMVPNSNKTDKASMLDEVIEYLKQLQAQLNMMKMSMSPLMSLMILQQKQLQMSMMMASMESTIGLHNNINGISPLFFPAAFMPMPSWGGSGAAGRLAVPMIDPLSAFTACQSQPIMEAYSRMGGLFQ